MGRPNTAAIARRTRARMTATVTIAKPGPVGELDPETGTYPPSEPIIFYQGPAYVRPTNLAPSDESQVGQSFTVHTIDVILPASVGVPDADVHTLSVTASGDPELTGLALPILRSSIDDWHTARTVVCQWAV